MFSENQDLEEIKQPPNTVAVFIILPKEKLAEVLSQGLSIEKNQRIKRNPRLEKIFSDIGTSVGISFIRTSCLFAYPRRPERIKFGLGFDPQKKIILEAKIDSSDAMVSEGELYTEADFALHSGNEQRAVELAREYWKVSIPFEKYLKEGHDGSQNDLSDFNFPEVLIRENIPSARLRVL